MLTNFWSKLKEKFSLKIVIPYIIIVLLIGVGYYFYNRNAALGEKLDAETKFRIALVDSVKYYKNAYNEVTAEKKTLQLDLKELNKNAEQLNANQKELLDRVNKISKDYTVIAAALVETNAILDGLRNDNAVVNKKDSTISFPLNTKDLQYNIRIGNVIPSLSKKPFLVFDTFNLPNKQEITFQWNKEPKEGYPVSFSISNSNEYFKTANIESYAIPELKKTELKPNFWNKVGKTFKEGGTNLVYIGIGAGVVLLLK